MTVKSQKFYTSIRFQIHVSQHVPSQMFLPLERFIAIITFKRPTRRVLHLMLRKITSRSERLITNITYKLLLAHMKSFLVPQHLEGIRELFPASSARWRWNPMDFF